MKLTTDTIKTINLFESLTGAKAKDCLNENGKIIFLVEEGNVKRALGKNGSNIRRISNLLKKEAVIIAFSNDVCKFVSNLIYPNRADEIVLEGETVIVRVSDSVTKGRIYGRSRENLKRINQIVKNYFKIKEVMIE